MTNIAIVAIYTFILLACVVHAVPGSQRWRHWWATAGLFAWLALLWLIPAVLVIVGLLFILPTLALDWWLHVCSEDPVED
jgi:hypothetical protein